MPKPDNSADCIAAFMHAAHADVWSATHAARAAISIRNLLHGMRTPAHKGMCDAVTRTRVVDFVHLAAARLVRVAVALGVASLALVVVGAVLAAASLAASPPRSAS